MRYLFVIFLLISSSSSAQQVIVPDVEGNHVLVIDGWKTITLFNPFSEFSLHSKQDLGIEKIVVTEGNFKNPKNVKEFYKNIYSFGSSPNKSPKKRLYYTIIANEALIQHLKNLITQNKKFTFSIYQKSGGYWTGIETDQPPKQLSAGARYLLGTPELIAKVNAEKLNVRAISNSMVVHVLERDDWVPVYSVENGWAHIGHNRKVSAKYLLELSGQNSKQLENEILSFDKKKSPPQFTTPSSKIRNKDSFQFGNFLNLGGGSSIIAFLLMFCGIFYAQNSTDSFVKRLHGPMDKLIIGFLLACSIYTILTGLKYWGYQVEIPAEASARASAKRGGGIVMLGMRLWPYICVFGGAIYVFIYYFDLKNNSSQKSEE